MYRTIVVPLDLTPRAQRAIPYGAALARQAGASLELLTVQPSHVTGDTTRPILADIARRHGVEARLRVAAAPDPAQAIVDAATDAEVLLCLQSHARGAVTELVLSSVSEQVMRACPYPVLLVGPHCGPAPDRFSAMVVALDGSDLAEHILPTAVRWSTDLDVTPWLFQVLDVPVPLEMGGDKLVDTSYVHRLADQLADLEVKAQWDAAHDRHPAAAISRFAETQPDSLIALTTHGRSGLSRVTIGSTALDVAHRATVPVLVLRPRDWSRP